MCGIAGIVRTDRQSPAPSGLVESMLGRLVHRGPDGQGLITGPGMALGHRRLAIIDLSPAAAQPLPSEDGKVFCAVNGEIYNHRELRRGLEAKGHRFRSRCDSEVVVHLYEETGPGAIERLEGMFAIAIWDGRLERLLLARDRMGEKPLYYHDSGERLAFASELGALLADPAIAAAPDAEAIDHYLTFRFVPSPWTGLRGILKLPPAHRLVWDRGRMCLQQYASTPFGVSDEAAVAPGARLPAGPPRSHREGSVEPGRAHQVDPGGSQGAGPREDLAAEPGEFTGTVRRDDPEAEAGDISSTGGRAAAPSADLSPARLRAAIGRAVGSRLESDVPLGVLLSGGLDSAVIALEASRALGGGSLKTFTVGFDEADYDESEAAAALARHLGTEHHAVRVRPDLTSELPAIVARFGEPFGDSSAAAVWILAREVRRHVTVALGGDGGDELFGGYDRYRAVRASVALRRLRGAPLLSLARRAMRLAGGVGRGRLRSRAAGSGGTDASPLSRGRRNLAGRLERFAASAALEPLEANASWLTHFTEEAKRALYADDFRMCVRNVDAGARFRSLYTRSSDPLDDILAADMRLGLPDGLLFKVDIASMASSLEVRSPFLDSELVRLAASIPAARKIGWTRGKKVLREAYDGLLPARTLRGRKAGFGLPIDRWLRGGMREMARDLLLGRRAKERGIFHTGGVQNLLEEHESGRANHDDRIWALICLELWFRGVVEERAASPAAGSAEAPAAAASRTGGCP